MEYKTKRKFEAAGKIAYGIGLVASGIFVGTGHGIIGGFLKNQHLAGQAGMMASRDFQEAGKKFKEGAEIWKEDR